MAKGILEERLQKGKKYRVRYRGSTQRRDRVAVLTYLWTNDQDELVWSGRPEFGTTELRKEDVIRVTHAKRDEPHHPGRLA